jgi:hypothetical protein
MVYEAVIIVVGTSDAVIRKFFVFAMIILYRVTQGAEVHTGT